MSVKVVALASVLGWLFTAAIFAAVKVGLALFGVEVG